MWCQKEFEPPKMFPVSRLRAGWDERRPALYLQKCLNHIEPPPSNWLTHDSHWLTTFLKSSFQSYRRYRIKRSFWIILVGIPKLGEPIPVFLPCRRLSKFVKRDSVPEVVTSFLKAVKGSSQPSWHQVGVIQLQVCFLLVVPCHVYRNIDKEHMIFRVPWFFLNQPYNREMVLLAHEPRKKPEPTFHWILDG